MRKNEKPRWIWTHTHVEKCDRRKVRLLINLFFSLEIFIFVILRINGNPKIAFPVTSESLLRVTEWSNHGGTGAELERIKLARVEG